MNKALSKADVEAAIAKHGNKMRAARALGVANSTFQDLCTRLGIRKVARSATVSAGGTGTKAATLDGAFLLRGLELSPKKPSDTMKAKFYSLECGMAYPLDALSKEWHVSVETLKRRAQEYDAFTYVERSEGDWVACAVHPSVLGKGKRK